MLTLMDALEIAGVRDAQTVVGSLDRVKISWTDLVRVYQQSGAAGVEGQLKPVKGVSAGARAKIIIYLSSSAGSSNAPTSLREGTRVTVAGKDKTLHGVVRFFGGTSFASGEWVGVELDTPDGRNDGSKNGTAYFSCEADHGIFVRKSQVRPNTGGSGLHHTQSHTRTRTPHARTRPHTPAHARTRPHMPAHARTHRCTGVRTPTHTHARVCPHAHAHPHTHTPLTHTLTPTHTHTLTPPPPPPPPPTPPPFPPQRGQ